MAKSNNRKDPEEKGRSGRSREDRPGRKRSGSEASDKKKDGYKAKRSFSKNKIFRELKEDRPARPKRPFASGEKKPFKRDFSKDKPDTRSSTDKKDWKSGENNFKPSEDRKSYRDDRGQRGEEREQSRRAFTEKDSHRDKPGRSFTEREERRPFKKDYKKEAKFSGFQRATGTGSDAEKSSRPSPDKGKKQRFSKPRKPSGSEDSRRVKYEDFEEGRAFSKQADDVGKEKRRPTPSKSPSSDGLIRLNKYLSNAGIASRREADNLIQGGTVKVNGVVVDQLGYKIKPGDKVTYGDSAVKSERKVYLLLNKPKDYITTVDDPRERKTVMELIEGACRERIYPVGRLDRNTTGLLLFTNDGELTTKLIHPKFGVKKVYHVTLNKGLKPDDFKAIIDGIELEDGPVKVDDVAFVGEGKKDVGIEIHSGRNRIVRRIFEYLGYDVLKLDRVVFAGLTKKDLPRGKHRFLTAKEISFLQMIG